jgi:hypothetical protein
MDALIRYLHPDYLRVMRRICRDTRDFIDEYISARADRRRAALGAICPRQMPDIFLYTEDVVCRNPAGVLNNPLAWNGLKTLVCSSMRYQCVDITPIHTVTTLTVLNLCFNDLDALPPEFGALSSLQRLDLEGNRISELPSEFTRLRELRELNVRNNDLRQLHESFCLVSLHVLDISNNHLQQLPDAIGAMTNMRKLRLRENELRELPASMERMRGIESLNVSHNQLNFFPPVICQLTSLRLLGLGWNRIPSVPENLQLFDHLVMVDLSHNLLGFPMRLSHPLLTAVRFDHHNPFEHHEPD